MIDNLNDEEMIDNKKNVESDDDAAIRKLMQAAKVQATPNLKYRIMHQIETEAALAKRQSPVSNEKSNPLKGFWTIYGVMYAVIALIAGGAYLTKGKEFLLTADFIGIVLFVAFFFSIYWLMTKVEERYRRNHSKNNNRI